MTNLLIQIAFAGALMLLFSWLAAGTWRRRRSLLGGLIAAAFGLLALLCFVVLGLTSLGFYRLYQPDVQPASDIQVSMSAQQLARGQRLAQLCTACHSSTGELPLDGGAENHIEGTGTLYAPNLTPGGPLADWSDGEIIRAIREGVDKNDHALLLMPSEQYHGMSDADVQAVVAYLRTQPPVARQVPVRQVNLLVAALVGIDVFPYSPQPPITEPMTSSSGSSEDYGHYLVTIAGCASCHGDDLRGGTSEFTPIGPSLPAILSRWTADEFVETIQTGVDPNGHTLDPERMPWPNFSAAFTSEELRAIYEYIQTLPPTAGRSE